MTGHPAYGLTRTQRDTLLIVQELAAIGGVAPTLSEIQHELGTSSRGSIHRILSLLRERGYIDWLPFRRRSIVVLRPIPFPEEPEIVGFFDGAAAVAL